MANDIKQYQSKTVGFKIECMSWSDNMDLLAISTSKGEVMVHRMNWQKICTQLPPADHLKVRRIAWRPNGKILTISYSNGLISLLDVESTEEIYSLDIFEGIVGLSWTRNVPESIVWNDVSGRQEFLKSYQSFLPELPSLNLLSSTANRNDYLAKMHNETLCFLIVATESSNVQLYAQGLLPCGKFNVANLTQNSQMSLKILDAEASAGLERIFVTCRLDDCLKIFVFTNEVLSGAAELLFNVAIQHGHILGTMNYINDTIQCIAEAWETVLLEMDNKLTKYANSQPEGSVSADFLELLVFGQPSEALEQFLTRELTEKGLRKLGNCIDLSYSTIQKLVVRPLPSATMNLCYHLNCLKGMALNTYHYKSFLGKAHEAALCNVAAFLMKTLDLQQTIDQSTRDFKIFFQWLFVAIIRLLDETVPDDVATVTQQEINYLAEFLNSLDDNILEDTADSGVTKRKFNLERVGQYLEDKPLTCNNAVGQPNLWDDLLEQNPCLKISPEIFLQHKNLSLIQEHNILKESVATIFKEPDIAISEGFRVQFTMCCRCPMEDNAPQITTHINLLEDNSNLIAYIMTPHSMLVTEILADHTVKSVCLQFKNQPLNDSRYAMFNNLKFKDAKFYNEEYLTLLLESGDAIGKECHMAQFLISNLKKITEQYPSDSVYDLGQSSAFVNMYDVLDSCSIKSIENFDGHCISVSGHRKIASVLSESRKKIRIYEMEVEEEETDLPDMSSNSHDNSKDSF